jgi:transcriptional regulator with XRE-family HTH domain
VSETIPNRIQDAPLRLIAARIRRARREADLTLDALGEAVGTSRHHLIRLEKGIHRPRVEMLTKIAEATGRHVEWFLDPDVDPSPFQEAAA